MMQEKKHVFGIILETYRQFLGRSARACPNRSATTSKLGFQKGILSPQLRLYPFLPLIVVIFRQQ
jgi:hypothetical protein